MRNRRASSCRTRRKVKGGAPGVESFLPDDIIIDIASRLQVKDVLRCRCVCKRLRDLTSTPDFVSLHKQRGMRGTGQTIIVEESKNRKRRALKHFFLDEWWLPTRNKSIIRTIDDYPLYCTEFSLDGLLVMTSTCCRHILIVNPLNREKVTIVCPGRPYFSTKVYGIFFNPTVKEYCLLLAVTWLQSYGMGDIYFKILNLGSKTCWIRDISGPWDQKVCYASTSGWSHPVLVDEWLYWIMHDDRDIMEFDTRSNEFNRMEDPLVGINVQGNVGIDLLNINGFLSLVKISKGPTTVDVSIWTMKERAAQIWTCSNYVVSLEVFPRYPRPIAIAVEYGELVMQSKKTLFVCNLEQGTTRVLVKMKNNHYPRFWSHGTSLASLKNCKPMIYMGGCMHMIYMGVKYKNTEKCQVCNVTDKEEAPSTNCTVNTHSDDVEAT